MPHNSLVHQPLVIEVLAIQHQVFKGSQWLRGRCAATFIRVLQNSSEWAWVPETEWVRQAASLKATLDWPTSSHALPVQPGSQEPPRGSAQVFTPTQTAPLTQGLERHWDVRQSL